jgi:hypothetical protein
MLSKVRANGGLTVPYGDLASWIRISSLSSGSLSLAPAGVLVAPDKTPILDKCTAINFTLYGRPADAALTTTNSRSSGRAVFHVQVAPQAGRAN